MRSHFHLRGGRGEIDSARVGRVRTLTHPLRPWSFIPQHSCLLFKHQKVSPETQYKLTKVSRFSDPSTGQRPARWGGGRWRCASSELTSAWCSCVCAILRRSSILRLRAMGTGTTRLVGRRSRSCILISRRSRGHRRFRCVHELARLRSSSSCASSPLLRRTVDICWLLVTVDRQRDGVRPRGTGCVKAEASSSQVVPQDVCVGRG